MTRPEPRLYDEPLITTQQHRWYRGVVVPEFRVNCGYVTNGETHRAIKAGFYEMHPDSPDLPSMKGMPQEEFERFMHYVETQARKMRIAFKQPRPTK